MSAPLVPPTTARTARDVAPVAVLAALGLGALADLAVRVLPQGVDFVLIVAGFLAIVGWTARRTARRVTPLAFALGALALAFPLATLTRDTPQLVVLDVLATLAVCCALVVALRRGDALALDDAGPIGYAAGGLATAARVVAGAPMLVARAADATMLVRPVAIAGAGTVLRGSVLAAPVLVVFAAFMFSADPAFGRLFDPLAALELDVVGEHLVVIGAIAWGTAGTVHAALLARDAAAPARDGIVATAGRLLRDRLDALRIGARETTVALMLVNALLVTFGLLQLRWLFGGADALQAAGVTVAEYARRGFGELVVLTLLALPLLLLANALSADGAAPTAPRPRAYRIASGLLVALVLVLLVSAADRLRLYVDSFGLSLARCFAAALMTWLGIVFAWAAVTLLRGRPGRFAAGAIGAGWALLLALHVVNPEARVAEVNLARAAAGRTVDTAYLQELGPDAVPVLAARIPALLDRHPDPAVRCRLRRTLHAAARRVDGNGEWRGWRLPVERAKTVLPAWTRETPPPCA